MSERLGASDCFLLPPAATRSHPSASSVTHLPSRPLHIPPVGIFRHSPSITTVTHPTRLPSLTFHHDRYTSHVGIFRYPHDSYTSHPSASPVISGGRVERVVSGQGAGARRDVHPPARRRQGRHDPDRHASRHERYTRYVRYVRYIRVMLTLSMVPTTTRCVP